MKGILNVGKDLVDEIRLNCKPELLKDIFNLRTAAWKYHQMSVEGGTIDIFSIMGNYKIEQSKRTVRNSWLNLCGGAKMESLQTIFERICRNLAY